MSTSKRDNLIAVSTQLFRDRGFHATGIDSVLKAAGVAKMTLYNHFGGKDELIIEVLRTNRLAAANTYEQIAQDASLDPFDRVLALFDEVVRAVGPGTGGCLFMHAAAEYAPNSTEEIAARVRVELTAHRQGQERVIAQACRLANVTEPEELARQLCLLLQGVVSGCADDCAETAIASARSAAEILLERYVS